MAETSWGGSPLKETFVERLPFGCRGWRLAWTLAVGLVVVAAGCGTSLPVQFVEGRVTLDGKPLGDATVGFTCTEAAGVPPAFGVTDDDGVYRLTTIGGPYSRGAVTGTFIVTVTKFETEPRDESVPQLTPPIVHAIAPAQYGNVSSSPLRVTVQEGANTGPAFDFALSSKPAGKP
jgi:hypothetical protein